MKIGIITVYNAVNYGSFLQAYCLQELLKSLGHEVKMIKTSSLLYEKWRFTSLFTYKPKKMSFKFKLFKNYTNAWKVFRIASTSEYFDIAIIGSDEMWELNNVTFKSLPQFFGIGVNARTKATYAVSSNSTNKEDIKKYEYVKTGIGQLDYVSVRDSATFEAYSELYNGNMYYCVDPTLLQNLDQYAIAPKIKEKYILCYTYSFKPYMINAVKDLAKRLRMKIVVAGQNFEWADECVPASAFEFLGLISNAEFIVTDTFHGITLSIGLQKEFVAFAYKTKVLNELEQFNMLDRNVEGKTSLMPFYEKKIDYSNIYTKIINPLKKKSIDYLKLILED